MQIKSSVGLAVGPVDATRWGVKTNTCCSWPYGILEIDDTRGMLSKWYWYIVADGAIIE